jgi:hypothetical protein
MQKFIKIFLITLLLLICPYFAKASTLYIDPSESQYGPGDSFPIDIKLNNEGACINALDVNLEFPKDNLRLTDFIIGDSIINFWIEKPEKEDLEAVNKNGILNFSGGTPGGYCGKIPGDPGESNIIARLIFKVPSLVVGGDNVVTAPISFGNSTQVLLNDGLGTADKLDFKGANINILSEPVNTPSDWQDQIKEDNIPPEPFFIELHSNANVYNGQYYIDFFTTDKQSGMDHYEVLEKRPDEKIGEKPFRNIFDFFLRAKKEPLNWKKGEIPYLLEDQTLKGIISVKAIDKAGNERLVDFVPPKSEQEKVQKISNKFMLMVSLIALGLLIFFLAILFTIRIIKKRKTSVAGLSQTDKRDEDEKL